MLQRGELLVALVGEASALCRPSRGSEKMTALDTITVQPALRFAYDPTDPAALKGKSAIIS
jgi:hypothetical protein